MGVTPAKLFKILTKYFKEEKTSKLKVAMINPALVRLLVRKIESYGGRRKFWNNPRGRAYFNRWCKLTGTPEIKSRSNFEDYVTDWLALSGIGKRNKIKVLQTALGTGGDREFSIFNKPPKS